MSSSLYADALAPFLAEVERLRPAGAEVIDAHTHLGLDEDGRSLTLAQLLSQLDDAGARRACVFPLHDPERHPAYRVPNDRVLAWAGESDERLVPFCRLDPTEDPLAESERCLAAGARGIKLHPASPGLRVRRSGHGRRVRPRRSGGRADPDPRRTRAAAARGGPRRPRPAPSGAVLILAHGAICDQGILTTRLADHPGVLYDISCFFPLDVIELFARVPAERIVFASDPPYGQPATSLYMALRVAQHAGLDESTTSGLLGGTMAKLLDGEALPPITPPRRGPTITLSGRLARVYGYASLVGPALFTGAIDQARAMLDMAMAACRDPEPGSVGEALETIAAALSAADVLLQDPDCAQRSTWSIARSSGRPPRYRTAAERFVRAAVRSRSRQPDCRPAIASALLPLAQSEALAERTRDLVDLRVQESTEQEVLGDERHRAGKLEQQRAEQVRHHRNRPPWSLRVHPRQRLGAQIEATDLDVHAIHRGVVSGGRNALALVIETEHRRKPNRLAAIASTPEPVPTSSSGPAGRSSPASPSSNSRHRRVLAWPPVPNACPGSITISSTPSPRRALDASHGGLTWRAGTSRPVPGAGSRGSIRTGDESASSAPASRLRSRW